MKRTRLALYTLTASKMPASPLAKAKGLPAWHWPFSLSRHQGRKSPFHPEKKREKLEVAFVESPIDALSLRSLGFDGEVVATMGQAGASLTSSLATFYRQEGWKVFSAFDADKAGEAMSKALGASERMRPKAKDWNADLLLASQQGHLKPRQVFLQKVQGRACEQDLITKI